MEWTNKRGEFENYGWNECFSLNMVWAEIKLFVNINVRQCADISVFIVLPDIWTVQWKIYQLTLHSYYIFDKK